MTMQTRTDTATAATTIQNYSDRIRTVTDVLAGYFDRPVDDPMEYVVMRNHIDGLLSVVLDYAAAIQTLAEGIEDAEIEKI